MLKFRNRDAVATAVAEAHMEALAQQCADVAQSVRQAADAAVAAGGVVGSLAISAGRLADWIERNCDGAEVMRADNGDWYVIT